MSLTAEKRLHTQGSALYVYVCVLIVTLCDPHGLQPARLLCPWGSPGKNTGVGCHLLLQGIVLTQGSDLCLYVSCIAGGFSITEPLAVPSMAPSFVLKLP